MTKQPLSKGDLRLVKPFLPEDVTSPVAYIQLIRSQIMGGKGSIADLVYFLEVSKRAGLNPTIKQIYAVFRWDSSQEGNVMTIQTGIDGLRSVAERSGLYAGSDEPKFKEVGTGEFPHPDTAKLTVYKLNKINGKRMPTTAIAYWDEFFPANKKQQFMWKKMPHTMLAKCAEAKALRKAFPVTMGIYTTEEMHQADTPLPKPKKKIVADTCNKATGHNVDRESGNCKTCGTKVVSKLKIKKIAEKVKEEK